MNSITFSEEFYRTLSDNIYLPSGVHTRPAPHQQEGDQRGSEWRRGRHTYGRQRALQPHLGNLQILRQQPTFGCQVSEGTMLICTHFGDREAFNYATLINWVVVVSTCLSLEDLESGLNVAGTQMKA